MKKILIFGGFGFVAKNIVERLRSLYDFVLIDRVCDSGFAAEYGVKTYICDLLKDDIGVIIEKEQPNYIINTISIVNAARDLTLIPSMVDINLSVLMRIFEASYMLNSLECMLHFGSAEEYGPIEMPYSEDMRENPMSPYALSKQISTNAAVMLNRNYGFPIVVVRPSNLFGKYQSKDKFIPYVIEQLKAGNLLKITLCEQKRDFISINSFVDCLALLLENHTKVLGEIINIASGKSERLCDIVEFTKKYFHSTSIVEYGAIPYRENEMMDFVCNIKKLEKITNTPLNIDFWAEYKQYIQ